jgi:hypothetical protein
MIWKEDRPESERPDTEASRWVYWVQGGIPIARRRLIPPGGPESNEWRFGDLEHAMFGGRSVELCYWLWARDQEDVTDRYKKVANQAAERLEQFAAMLRKVGER